MIFSSSVPRTSSASSSHLSLPSTRLIFLLFTYRLLISVLWMYMVLTLTVACSHTY